MNDPKPMDAAEFAQAVYELECAARNDFLEYNNCQLHDLEEAKGDLFNAYTALLQRCADAERELKEEREHSAMLLAGYPDMETPTDIRNLKWSNGQLATQVTELESQLTDANARAEKAEAELKVWQSMHTEAAEIPTPEKMAELQETLAKYFQAAASQGAQGPATGTSENPVLGSWQG